MQNPYLPLPVRIDGIVTETEDKNLKTFTLTFLKPEDEAAFAYRSGQFAELSVTGKVETSNLLFMCWQTKHCIAVVRIKNCYTP